MFTGALPPRPEDYHEESFAKDWCDRHIAKTWCTPATNPFAATTAGATDAALSAAQDVMAAQ